MGVTTRELDADHLPATHWKPSAWVTELVNRTDRWTDGWMDENTYIWGRNTPVISVLPDRGVLLNQTQIAATLPGREAETIIPCLHVAGR